MKSIVRSLLFPHLVIDRCLPSTLPDCSMSGSVPAKATKALADLNLSTLDTSAINLVAVLLPTPGIESIDSHNFFFDSSWSMILLISSKVLFKRVL